MNPSGFIGFPDIKMKPVIIPDHFFTELLPQINDLAELKLTLHCFWLLNEQEGDLKYLRGADLRNDAKLLQSLSLDSDLRSPEAVLEDALQRAVARNTLLKLEIETPDETRREEDKETRRGGDQETRRQGDEESGLDDAPRGGPLGAPLAPSLSLDDWYFINTVKGRQTLALIRQGKLTELQQAIPEEARLRVKRPNIFVLYEQNISLMTPLIAEQLRDMEKSYPPDWIDEAFEIAISRNKRNLRYIQSILKRWETEGKQPDGPETPGRDSEAQRRRRYIPEEFADVILG